MLILRAALKLNLLFTAGFSRALGKVSSFSGCSVEYLDSWESRKLVDCLSMCCLMIELSRTDACGVTLGIKLMPDSFLNVLTFSFTYPLFIPAYAVAGGLREKPPFLVKTFFVCMTCLTFSPSTRSGSS